jgi:hypothetical protein
VCVRVASHMSCITNVHVCMCVHVYSYIRASVLLCVQLESAADSHKVLRDVHVGMIKWVNNQEGMAGVVWLPLPGTRNRVA